MPSFNTKIISRKEVNNWVLETAGFNHTIALLLCGDRLSCCDEAVAIYDKENIIGVATIAPNGEEKSGIPTIVGMYIMPKFRGNNLGVKLFEETVKRCVERGFNKIHIDVMSTSMNKTLKKMCPNLRKHLTEEHHSFGSGYIMDPMQ